MLRFFRLFALPSILCGAALLLSCPAAQAQTALPAGPTAAHGYNFLTVITTEGVNSWSYILFAPAFQGKTEVALEGTNVLGVEKYKERILRNAQVINEQLSALTVAGWALVQVYTTTNPTNGRCYLLRKAKS